MTFSRAQVAQLLKRAKVVPHPKPNANANANPNPNPSPRPNPRPTPHLQVVRVPRRSVRVGHVHVRELVVRQLRAQHLDEPAQGQGQGQGQGSGSGSGCGSGSGSGSDSGAGLGSGARLEEPEGIAPPLGRVLGRWRCHGRAGGVRGVDEAGRRVSYERGLPLPVPRQLVERQRPRAQSRVGLRVAHRLATSGGKRGERVAEEAVRRVGRRQRVARRERRVRRQPRAQRRPCPLRARKRIEGRGAGPPGDQRLWSRHAIRVEPRAKGRLPRRRLVGLHGRAKGLRSAPRRACAPASPGTANSLPRRGGSSSGRE